MDENTSPPTIIPKKDSIGCRLVHHGAAAAVSGNQIVTWISDNNKDVDGDEEDTSSLLLLSTSSIQPSASLVYASNAILNITETVVVNVPSSNTNSHNNGSMDTGTNRDAQQQQQPKITTPSLVRHVRETLRCTELEKAITPSISPIVITCVVSAKYTKEIMYQRCNITALIAGFSNGMIQVWLRDDNNNTNIHQQKRYRRWTEHTITTTSLQASDNNDNHHHHHRSITSIDAIWTTASNRSSSIDDENLYDHPVLQIAAGTSAGMTWYQCEVHQQQVSISSATATTSSSTTVIIQAPTTNGTSNDNHVSDDNERQCTSTSTIVKTTTRFTTPSCGAVASIQFHTIPMNALFIDEQYSPSTNNILMLFVGTAAPRHNKIHVYQCCCAANNNHPSTSDSSLNHLDVRYSGYLTGHEDWVTTLACWADNKCTDNTSNTFLLASGSQDARIRIWKFSTVASAPSATTIATAPVLNEAEKEIDGNNDDRDDDEDNEFLDDVGESRLEILHSTNVASADAGTCHVVAGTTSVTLEALLYGHEEGVTSVTWHPDPMVLYGIDKILISSSTDRTILIWSETPNDDPKTSNYGGIWTPLSRVGSAGGILGGSIGSTLLGYCGVTVDPTNGRTIVGHAYGGALHMWDVIDKSLDKENKQVDAMQWKASPCITGHFAGVTDCCWEASNGDYLLTVSNDQTCRIWAPIRNDLLSGSNKSTWLELARPQVHGYNLAAVASLSTSNHPHLIATGADEKEIRVFDAPIGTLRLLDAFTDIKKSLNEEGVITGRVERAYIPSLGLSNKASPADAAAEDEEIDHESKSLALVMSRLPLERDLGAVSLWPESQKLFGHNTEIYCLSASCGPDSNEVLLASSCKARDADDAKIRLWNVRTGQCVQVLTGGHRSTVATMSFTSNGQYLASSGKDRRLCLWKRQDMSGNNENIAPMFELIWALDSAHKRIIWSVHFCPYETRMLASGSRDGIVKIWSMQDDKALIEIMKFSPLFQRSGKPDAVTSLAFAPTMLSNLDETYNAIVALGLESGRIEFWCVPYKVHTSSLIAANPPYPISCIDPTICHCDTVTKLAWRSTQTKSPTRLDNSDNSNQSMIMLHLASCSFDHGCRIFEIKLLKG